VIGPHPFRVARPTVALVNAWPMNEGEQPALTGRYGLLLITLVAAYLFSALAHTGHAGPLNIAFVAAIGLLALRHIRIRTSATVVSVGLLLASAIAAAFCVTSTNKIAEGIGSLWSALVLLMTVVIIIERVVRLSEVTVQSLYAAFSAYLLIGLMFSAFFGALSSFVSEPFFANNQPVNPQTLQYFSFVTLATLGYGDFTAAGSLGRALAVLEALGGQVFLATLVARLVSLYGTARRRPPPSGLRGRPERVMSAAGHGDAAQQFVDGALDETGGGRA
jgi:ABC-type polysaccharide/polyol phosphate export permease